MSKAPTLSEVRQNAQPSDKFLCKIKSNVYALQFLRFQIKNSETNQVFYTHEQEVLPNSEMLINDDDYPPEMLAVLDQMRTIHYEFPEDFLRCKIITSSITFKVGDLPIKDLVIVDRFYFKDKLIKTYEFKFPFCIPNSTNDWDYVYEFPALSNQQISEMINSPGETHSETFFFVGEEMILHNKALYGFTAKH